MIATLILIAFLMGKVVHDVYDPTLTPEDRAARRASNEAGIL